MLDAAYVRVRALEFEFVFLCSFQLPSLRFLSPDRGYARACYFYCVSRPMPVCGNVFDVCMRRVYESSRVESSLESNCSAANATRSKFISEQIHMRAVCGCVCVRTCNKASRVSSTTRSKQSVI